MPDNRSPVSKYLSKFGLSRWVTAAQYLAEVMCERRAKAEKKALPLQFWKTPPWDAVYRQQVAAVSRLFSRLDPKGAGTAATAVSRFLRSQRGKTAYSMAGAWVVPFVEAEHKKVLAERASAVPTPEETPREGPRPPERPRDPFVRGESLLTKLKGID